jgi:multidrug efflux pump subunit AcrA (membrane-fusion protein)
LNARRNRILAASLWALGAVGCGTGKGPPPAPPPPTVYVGTVLRSDVPLYIESVGVLDGYDNADIRARVKGFLRTQNYKDGSRVKAGDLLFTIEPTEYASAVDPERADRLRKALP